MWRGDIPTNRPFFVRPERYAENARQGADVRAIPARLETPAGEIEKGVAVFVGTQIRLMLPEVDAWRLADQVADALEGHDS